MGLSLAQSLPFVHPAIAGAAALTGLIPIVIHLINRRRFRRVPWAAMKFLLAANRRSAKRLRLEQALLLLARIALLVLLGLAVARPFVPSSTQTPFASSRVHRILLIDNSLSMQSLSDTGESRFENARRYALQLVRTFPGTDGVSIVTLASPAKAVLAHAVYDRRIVRERLEAMESTQRSTDTIGAVTMALDLLRDSDAAAGNRAVYLISDLPQGAWKGDTPGRSTPAIEAARRLADALADSASGLHIVSAATENGANVALTELDTESQFVAVNMPVRLSAKVTNFGAATVRGAALQIRLDGRIVRRQPLPTMTPGRSIVATVTTEIAGPGTHRVEGRISGSSFDSLEPDDRRYLSVEVRKESPVLLVDGRPGTTRFSGAAGFVAAALAPSSLGPADTLDVFATTSPVRSSPIKPKIITEPELSGEALAEYDVVALCNVGRPGEHQWRQLEGFVEAGGGLLIFVGDTVSVDDYERFGHADGRGLLMGKLGRATDLVLPADVRGCLALTSEVHPVVADFSDAPSSGLFGARVDRYMPVELDPQRADVVLSLANGDPALIASSFGRGRVLLCTTTANMDWTNLPAKGDFVSLVLNAVAYLSRSHGAHRAVLVGQELREPLTAVESAFPLLVTGTRGATSEAALVPNGESLAAEFGPMEQSGFATLAIGSTERVFAANVDPDESDLHSIGEAEFGTLLQRPVRFVRATDSRIENMAAPRSAELSSITLCGVVALLFIELWMASRFGRADRGTASRGEAAQPMATTSSSPS